MLPERIKRRRLRRALKIVAISSSLIAGGTIFWALFYSPLLTVNNIIVKDTDASRAARIKDTVKPFIFGRAYVVFKKNHPFFIDEKLIRATILERFTQIGNTTLAYHFSQHTLEIHIDERKAVAHWCKILTKESGAEKCYIIDQQGIIYAETGQREGSQILVIRDVKPGEVSVGMRPVPTGWMDYFSALRDRLKPITWITTVVIEEESIEAHYVRLQTADGWDLLIDTTSNPDDIANALQTLMAKEIGDKTNRLAYIDLRIPNRAYYKLK